MFRVFFTGAFRKPRELNWLIGLGLIALGIIEGFAGYSLPDDLLSGTGLRIADAIMLSIPVVGTWVSFLVFGGPFPGDVIIGRLYIAHVLLIPAHPAGADRRAPGAGRAAEAHPVPRARDAARTTVSGERVFPIYAAKAGGFFFIVFGVCAALGGLAQINPVWLFGPYNPAQVSSGSQPDWYMMFLDGSTRLFPSWEIRLWGHTIPPLFWPTVVLPGILFTLAGAYPFIEAKMTKDTQAAQPAAAPARRAGAHLAGRDGADVLPGAVPVRRQRHHRQGFDISLNAMTWGGRIALLDRCRRSPTWSTYRVCLGLQRHDREVLEHGIETGIIKMLPTGEFIEVHQPLGPVDEHGHGALAYAGAPVPKRMNQLGAPRRSSTSAGSSTRSRRSRRSRQALDELEAVRERTSRHVTAS